MATSNSIADRINAFVIERFPLAKREDFHHQSSLIEEGIIDSLGILEVVTFLEDTFGVVISDDEMLSANFDSINTLSKLVSSKYDPAHSEV